MNCSPLPPSLHRVEISGHKKKCLTINALAPPAVFFLLFLFFFFLTTNSRMMRLFLLFKGIKCWMVSSTNFGTYVFPFVYHFNSRIGVLVRSSFANFNNILASFQNLFVCLEYSAVKIYCDFDFQSYLESKHYAKPSLNHKKGDW